jgi:hypothetical protein
MLRASPVLRRTRSLTAPAFALVCSATFSSQALAAQVQAYVLFELSASSSVSATTEKLRSTSLSNCLQLIIGGHAREVFVHVACDERGTDTSYLGQAVMALSRVDGVARATVVLVKTGTN